MQKKTTARHVGIWMGFFLMKYLIRFHGWKTRFTMIDSITIWNNKMATSHFNERNSLLGEIIVPQCFSLRPRVLHLDLVFSTETSCFAPGPVFSTRPRVFHQTPCFPHPVFSTPNVFHNPCFPHPGTPYPGTPAPRFLPTNNVKIKPTVKSFLNDWLKFAMN